MRCGHVLWYARTFTQAQHIYIWLWEQAQSRKETHWASVPPHATQEQRRSSGFLKSIKINCNHLIHLSLFQFSFESCKFKIQRSKEGTGRIVVWMLGITNAYTIEASFGGSLLGSRKGTHFNTQVIKQNTQNTQEIDSTFAFAKLLYPCRFWRQFSVSY